VCNEALWDFARQVTFLYCADSIYRRSEAISIKIASSPSAPRKSPSGLRYLKEPRDIAVVKATAERAGWQPRSSPCLDHTGDTRSTAAPAKSGQRNSPSPMIAG
jgi:hypothetical protein